VPDSVVPGGLPTEALLSHLAVSKYCDGLPRDCSRGWQKGLR
jgi:hypothetical protein